MARLEADDLAVVIDARHRREGSKALPQTVDAVQLFPTVRPAARSTPFALAGTRVKALEGVSPARFPSGIAVGTRVVMAFGTESGGLVPCTIERIDAGSNALPTSWTRSTRSSVRRGMP